MNSNKRKRHTEEELKIIFDKENFSKKYFLKFLSYYEICFNELYIDYQDYEDHEFEGDSSVQSLALSVTIDRISIFLEQIAMGHGEEWAQIIVDNSLEGESSIFHAYHDLMEINSELAKKELKIHSKSFNEDEYFEKHYIYLFEIIDDVNGRIEKAKKYSKLFKEQIANGESEIFAHKYSNLMADGDYHKIYCKEYAFAYDNAITNNKSNEYAEEYAEKYGSALANIKRRGGIADNKELIDYKIKKINAYMKAWEYNKKNNLNNFSRFAEIYVNISINFEIERTELLSIDEIDAIILEKTLIKINSN